MSIADEFRSARLAAGLSQAAVARASGISTSQISRIERAQLATVSIARLSKIAVVLGLDLSVRVYPAGGPLRDQAQIALIGRFRARVGPGLRIRTEVVFEIAGDLRAWDVVVDGGSEPVAVDAETRVRDWQALERRFALKVRDSGIRQVILLVSDTRANRAALRDAGPSLREMFPVLARDALRALGEGRDPGGSSVILL